MWGDSYRNLEPAYLDEPLEPSADELREVLLPRNGTASDRAQVESRSERPLARRIERFTVGELQEQFPTLDSPVIEGLLREGETINIVSSSKIGKSWLLYSLALSIATGRPWLGKFFTTQGKVLLIDNELRKPTLASRIKTVAEAMELTQADYADQIEVWPLRGNLRDIFQIGIDLDRIEPGEFKAAFIDAKYRMTPAGQSENDNSAETTLYNVLDAHAERLGLAFGLVSHSSKGSQSDKRVTDVGAGAGAQSRAADTHLVLREHEEEDCVVLDAAIRSFAPVEPIVLRWCFPLWRPQEHLDPEALKRPKAFGDARQEQKDREAKDAVLNALDRAGTDQNRRQLREATGLSHDRLNRIIAALLKDLEIEISRTTEARNHGQVEWFKRMVERSV